jgi:predicted permease
VLKPANVREPERLVGVYSPSLKKPGDYRLFSYPAYRDARAAHEVFEDVFAFSPVSVGVRDGEFSRRLPALRVSASYLSMLGSTVALGRDFVPADEDDAEPVVIVSHAWWLRNGARRDILDTSLTINGRPATVIGVLAPGFTGMIPTSPPDFLLPLFSSGDDLDGLTDRSRHNWFVIGRLRPDVSIERANERLAMHAANLGQAFPREEGDHGLLVAKAPIMAVSSAPHDDRRTLGSLSLLLIGMSAAVLLIACLNLANMLLARSAARRREVAIRLALGARRRRILRQLITEGGLLALAGGALGLLLSAVVTSRLVMAVNAIAPMPIALDVKPDATVLLVSLGFCLFATLAFALGPAWRLSRPDVAADMKSQPDGSGSDIRRRFVGRHLLAVTQVALSLTLLVGAGLFGRAAYRVSRLDTGFPTDRGLYLHFDAGLASYPERRLAVRMEELVQRVRAMPGVESAALAATFPMGYLSMGEIVRRAGTPWPTPDNAATPEEGLAMGSVLNEVSSDYFQTLGVKVIRGREFEPHEAAPGRTHRVAVINTVLAEKLWPREEALGRSVQLPGSAPLEVVGVVANHRATLKDSTPQPMIFLPCGRDTRSEMLLVVRGSPGLDAGDLLRRTREEARRLDERIPLVAARTLRDHVDANFQAWIIRAAGGLFAALGASAMLLAVLGVYGVTAFGVARRTREIGIRMAMGSTRAAVLRLILAQGASLTAAGLVGGLVLGALAALAMKGFLFEVRPFDPWVFTCAFLLLASASLLACWLPARRAARVDPMVALRNE